MLRGDGRPAALPRVAWIAERSGWPLLRDGRLPVNPSQPDGLVRGAYCVSRIMMSHNRQALKVREIGPGRSASAVSLDRGTVHEVVILGCRYPRVCASRLTHSSRCCERRLFGRRADPCHYSTRLARNRLTVRGLRPVRQDSPSLGTSARVGSPRSISIRLVRSGSHWSDSPSPLSNDSILGHTSRPEVAQKLTAVPASATGGAHAPN